MKQRCISLIIVVVATFCRAESEVDLVQRYGRDVTKEISLAKALTAFNKKYPDANPLTEREIVAAIRNWDREAHPVKDSVFTFYLKVAEKRVFPKGMYFSRIDTLLSGDYAYKVDWKDLSFTSFPWRQEERQEEPHPDLGYGYCYRIRARYTSSRPLTAGERVEIEKAEERAGMQLRTKRAAAAHAGDASERVGVFKRTDLLVAFYKSAAWSQHLKDLVKQREEAKEKGDAKKVKALEERGAQSQERAHLQLSGKSPLDNIFEHITDKLPGVSKDAGVAVIVEQPLYTTTDVELVDVTELLVKLLPSKTKK